MGTPTFRFLRSNYRMAAGLFLAFVAGTVTGMAGLPPTMILTAAHEGFRDVRQYARAALTATPSQHLGPRSHPGDGVTVSVPGKTHGGYTFLAGLFGQRLGFRLVGEDGQVLHDWPIDFFQIAPAEMRHRYHALIHGSHLYPNGDVVANLDGRGLVRFDHCGAILWQNRDGSHHSVHVDDDGFIWTPLKARPVKGAPFDATPFSIDRIGRFEPDTGRLVERIDLGEVLARSGRQGLIQFNAERADDIAHVNDVEILGAEDMASFPGFTEGDILVSSRNLHQLWVIDGTSKDLKWWYAGILRGQHDPDFEHDGTILVLDNQPDGPIARQNGFTGRGGGSRMVSVDPASKTARVVYETDDRNTFYTPYRGKHQSLPNGNLLITETDAGRAFEVTPGGEVVWSYVNGWDDARVGWLMSARRVEADYLDVVLGDCPA